MQGALVNYAKISRRGNSYYIAFPPWMVRQGDFPFHAGDIVKVTATSTGIVIKKEA